MPCRRLTHIPRPAVALGRCAMALAIFACSEERAGSGPRPPAAPPTDPEIGEDAPVNLTYVCGNRFVITNAQRFPLTVTYRVDGTEEEGTADLAAAPDMDPAFSEQVIEVRTKGAVQLFAGDRFLVARANGRAPCLADAPVALSASLAGEVTGEWSAPFTLPIVAIHMALLPDQRVLAIGRLGTPQVWDPILGTFTAVPPPAWLFCAGQTLLPDGRVFFAGGHIAYDYGLPNTTLFNPADNTWSSSTPMARGRWYPTTTTLANGDVLILAGRDQASVQVPVPEIWSNGTLRQLTGASKTLPYYPRAFLTPKGTVFIAGQDVYTRYLNTTGSGSWKSGPKHLLTTARDYGSAVMYEGGKILYAGGSRTTNTAEVVDLNAATPAWQWTGSMAFARRHLNLTVLPTGEVLATGGVSGTVFNDNKKPVYAAELWNPVSGQWTTLASNAVIRDYHGTALLLPDGRVLVAGGSENAGLPSQKNAEIFSPPYLFRGARPTISEAPATIPYVQPFRILTADAGSIAKVTMIRLATVTHAFDQNARMLKLAFTADAEGLTVTAPASANVAPPGHYMVFIVNGADVPSVAKIVKIN
jgi:galactose oxidase